LSYNTEDIRQIRRRIGLSQAMFAGSLGVSPKTVEAWESGRNKPEGSSRRLLDIAGMIPVFSGDFKPKQKNSM
jgi:putative transcriptional regulator